MNFNIKLCLCRQKSRSERKVLWQDLWKSSKESDYRFSDCRVQPDNWLLEVEFITEVKKKKSIFFSNSLVPKLLLKKCNSGSLGIRKILTQKRKISCSNCSEQFVITCLQRAEILEVTSHVVLLGSLWYLMKSPESLLFVVSPGTTSSKCNYSQFIAFRAVCRPWNWGLPQGPRNPTPSMAKSKPRTISHKLQCIGGILFILKRYK